MVIAMYYTDIAWRIRKQGSQITRRRNDKPMKMLKGGPVGAVGTARSFMNVVKDIDFREARDRAEEMPKILVVADSSKLADDAATRLFGADDRNGVNSSSWSKVDGDFDPHAHDVVIVYDPEGAGLFDTVRLAVGEKRDTSNVFFLSASMEADDASVRAVTFQILEMLPEMAPAFGRFHPQWRKAAVSAIVDQTSRANAQFALVSNIPTMIPVLGSFIAAGADLIVLTKNQVMMCYKIAAAHGEDLEDQMSILRELTPVVGVGFLWRTAAREAAAMIPFAGGTIPKVGIAYAGTLAMGKAADYYYQFGSKPSRHQLAKLKDQAMKLAEGLPIIREFVDDDQPKDAVVRPLTAETTEIEIDPPSSRG